MGAIILTVVVIVEIALAVFCFITKSNQTKCKSVVRITAFLLFVLLSVFKMIHWNAAYYLFTLLLLVLAFISAFTLIHQSDKRKPYQPIRSIFKTVGLILLFSIAVLPAIFFPKSSPLPATGSYPIASTNITYTDTNRIDPYTDTGEYRKLNVTFWYPENTNETYPLILFSHGALGIRTSNESLYRELASHGYVVCTIDHTYHSLYTKDANGKVLLVNSGYMHECLSEDVQADINQSYVYYQKWMEIRTDDIRFVLDHILTEANNGDPICMRADDNKIGVMGHSLGGSGALGIGRTRDDVSAVIALESPYLYDIVGIENDHFVFTDQDYPVPVLNVYSDDAWSILDKRPQYAQNNAMLTDDLPDSYNVHISGAGHFTLTDLALKSPPLVRILNGHESTTDTEYCLKTINRICLDFFDYYLKGTGTLAIADTYSGETP